MTTTISRIEIDWTGRVLILNGLRLTEHEAVSLASELTSKANLIRSIPARPHSVPEMGSKTQRSELED